MPVKHTQAVWELNMDGIAEEIRDNGLMNGIDVKDKDFVNHLAERVITNSYYTREVMHLQYSKRRDKITRYYDILWETVERVLQ